MDCAFFLDFGGHCKIGDGTGGSETKLNGLYTIQECIKAVKEKYLIDSSAHRGLIKSQQLMFRF